MQGAGERVLMLTTRLILASKLHKKQQIFPNKSFLHTINPLPLRSPIFGQYPKFISLKTLKNQMFSKVFSGYKMRTLAKNGLIKLQKLMSVRQ